MVSCFVTREVTVQRTSLVWLSFRNHLLCQCCKLPLSYRIAVIGALWCFWFGDLDKLWVDYLLSLSYSTYRFSPWLLKHFIASAQFLKNELSSKARHRLQGVFHLDNVWNEMAIFMLILAWNGDVLCHYSLGSDWTEQHLMQVKNWCAWRSYFTFSVKCGLSLLSVS